MTAPLINFNDPIFPWLHAMDHRTLLGAMYPYDRIPLSAFSVAPYWIRSYANNGDWHQRHQQAHLDVITTAPPTFGQPYAQNFLDRIQNTGQQAWWTFANEREHQTAHSMYDLTQPRFPAW